ncbi:MAG TPA: lipopolysaccharide biosynthesis protein [Acidimicrobiales bacterium]|nr:lipopolysaccharide biosynthesis protein [Acidimicrobiales bacterium]
MRCARATARAQGSSNLGLVLRDMPFYAVANGSLAAGGFLALALFTRWLSPLDYGLYALTLTTATMAEAALFSWVNNAVLRYLPAAEDDGSAEVFLATNFIVSCGLLVVVSAVWLATTVVVGLASPALASLLQAGVLVLAARTLFGFAVSLARARRQTARYAVYTAVSAFGAVILPAVLRVTVGTGAHGILVMASLAAVMPAAVELVRSRSLGWLRPRLFLRAVVRRSGSYGIPLAGAAFGAALLSIGDRYILQLFRGPSAVGSYSAGYDLADKSLKLILTVLVAATLPVVMQVLSRQGVEEANRLIDRMLRVYLVWMVPVTALLIAFRGPLVDVVLGPGFERAVTVVPWVAVATLCWGGSQIVAQIFQVHERTGPLLSWLLAAAGVNAVLNVWLIPAAGLTGAAVATTAGYGFYLAVLWHRRVRSPALTVTAGEAAIALAAGAVMLAAMTWVPLDQGPRIPFLAVQAVFGWLVYILFLRLLAPHLFAELSGDVRAALAFARRRRAPELSGSR